MQRLEVSGAVRLIYNSLGVKGLTMEQEAAWAPELAWTFWEREKYIFPARILTADRPVPSLVRMPIKTTLAQTPLLGT